MTDCDECGNEVAEDSTKAIVSGSGVWCSVGCWEEWHGQPWLHERDAA